MRRSAATRTVVCTLALCVAGCSQNGAGSPDAGPAEAGGDAVAAVDLVIPNKPGGNPLVPEQAAYPFPSDFYLVKDSTTATGRRVSFPAGALPKGVTPQMFGAMDGFSLIPQILAYLPGGVDGKSLPDPSDPAATVATGSPVLLVEQGTWEKLPLLAENDLTAASDATRALIIRPLRALKPATGYVVILRDGLRTPAGEAHRANDAFRALRDGIPTGDPAIEQQREDFKQVRAAIDELGLEPEEVVLAWSFHTRSEEQVTGTLLAIQDLANKATLGGYTIISDTTDTKNRQIVATFKAPNFIDAKSLLIAQGAGGKPVQQGERDVTFSVTIPLVLDKPRPVLLFGHGFFGSWKEGTGGSFNALCHQGQYSAVSTYIGFNEENYLKAVAAFAGALDKFDVMVADVLQTFANYTALARLVKEQLTDDITLDTGGGPFKPFDPQQVHYIGISNGGTFGYVVAATSPQLSRAVLVVGGGGLIHFLQRAVQWNDFEPFVKLMYPNALDKQLMLSLMQQVIDPIDAMSYAPHLVHDRFPGCKPLQATLHMAVNDTQVRNLVTEWVARTAEIPLITPSPKSIYGLETITAAAPDGAPAGTLAGLFVYDQKVAAPPVGNLPPATDNGTHGGVRKLDVYKQHVITFIDEGKLVQVCDGACDPD